MRHDGLSETELLGTVAAGGAAVSARQLKRWRMAGLVPRPTWQHEPGRPGSRSLYPRWAPQHVIQVRQQLRGRRRLDETLVGLWWDGWWADRAALRAALIAPFEAASAQARELTADLNDPYDAAQALVEEAKRERGGLGAIAKRLPSRADRETVMHTFFLLGLGGEPEWETQDVGLAEPDVIELVARGTGVERAREPIGSAPAWLTDEIDVAAELAGVERNRLARCPRSGSGHS